MPERNYRQSQKHYYSTTHQLMQNDEEEDSIILCTAVVLLLGNVSIRLRARIAHTMGFCGGTLCGHIGSSSGGLGFCVKGRTID